MFEDFTDILNQSLRPELRKLALYLKSERADITVKGEGSDWKVVLYENSNCQSHALYLWRTHDREGGLRLARHLEDLLRAASTERPVCDLVPAKLKESARSQAAVPLDLILA